MKEKDKQWSGEKDKDRNMSERDKMVKERSKQQQGEDMGNRQQGGMGRKPGMERDRDYDPDGDRMGRNDDQSKR